MNFETLRRGFRVGDWVVEPDGSRMIRSGEVQLVEPRTMDLFVFLATHAGRTVTKDEIFSAVWSETFVTDGALYKCVHELRQILEENPSKPKLIVTVARRGYRLEAVVRPTDPELSKPTALVSPLRTGRWLAVSLAVLALGLTGLVFWWVRSERFPKPADSGKIPTVLLIPLVNRTGEELLDGTLEVVLEGRLNDSGQVRLVSRPRIENTLELMRRPLDTVLTEELAREVSQRDGEIDYLVSGRIDNLGARYHVTLRVLDARSQELLESNDRGTSSLDLLLPMVDQQAFWLIDKLGSGSPVPEPKPERVTTTSLRALKLYTQGIAELPFWDVTGLYDPSLADSLRHCTAAAELFEECARLDPDFGSALIMLAWCRSLQDQLDPRRAQELEVIREVPKIVTRPTWDTAKAALEASENVPLVERAFIRGFYAEVKGELEEAVRLYRLALELQPEHRWAGYNLVYAAWDLKDPDLVVEGILASSQSRMWSHEGPTLRLLVQIGGVEPASELRRRLTPFAGSLAEPVPCQPPLECLPGNREDQIRHISVATFRAFDVWKLWQEGKYPEALSEVDVLSQEVKELHSKGVRNNTVYGATMLAGMQIGMGKLKDALATMRDYGLDRIVGGCYVCWLSSPAILFSVLEENAERLEPSGGSGLFSLFKGTFGPVATQLGVGSTPRYAPLRMILDSPDPDERIDRLKRWLLDLSLGASSDTHSFFGIRWLLARELMEQGRDEEAIQILEQIVADRNRTWVGGIVYWQKAALDLARIYQRHGRSEEAARLLAELSRMLEFADREHPVLREMESFGLVSAAG